MKTVVIAQGKGGHLYFPGGSKIWEQLAKDWGFRDFYGQDSWRSATPGV